MGTHKVLYALPPLDDDTEKFNAAHLFCTEPLDYLYQLADCYSIILY